MVDFPDLDEPTMNVISFAGRKMETLERTGMVGRDGYAKVTLWSASSLEHHGGVLFLRTRRFLDCGVDVEREMKETIQNFLFGKNDELGNGPNMPIIKNCPNVDVTPHTALSFPEALSSR